ncbi:MAG: HWE histidine kinase domain-containing protein, partial [Novosphingobium sp.]|nr:HWE histidine kinase domain-containing protein [Novosphingobium sp.]
LFAVILAIVRLSARNAPEATDVTDSIAQRIQALLIAHEVTQGAANRPVADLAALVETTLAPHRSEHANCSIEGPPVPLPAAKVQPLGLVLHELATNAVKYGAWSQDGALTIRWSVEEGDGDNSRRLALDWREHCPRGCSPGDRKGFGSMLMESSARQLQGAIERTFPPEGCRVRIEFPLT